MFRLDKCKLVHVGKNNLKLTYTAVGTELVTGTEKKGLGVIMDSFTNIWTLHSIAGKVDNKVIRKKGGEAGWMFGFFPLHNNS